MKRSKARLVAGSVAATLVATGMPDGLVGADDGPVQDPMSEDAIRAFQEGAPRDLELRDALTARYPAFGGFFVEESQVAVLLFQGGQAPADAELAEVAAEFGFGPSDYVVQASEWARDDLLELEAAVIESFADARLPGTEGSIVSIGVVDRLGQVTIGVVGVDGDTARDALTAGLGGQEAVDRLFVQQVDHRIGETFANRWTDVAPFNGGNLVTKDTGGSCTSGWPVLKNGTRRFLGAGHCGEAKYYAGANLYIGESDGSTIPPGATMGSATVDAMLIEGGSVNNKTWRHYDQRVIPAGTPQPGEGRYVCFGGAVTAFELLGLGGSETEKCGTIDIVDRVNYYGAAGDGWRKHLSCVWGNRALAQGGDSGGPVYWDTVFGLGAAGTITGNDTSPIPYGEGTHGTCFTQINQAQIMTQSTVITS